MQSVPKVKIVAIAKDEAAYLPEWIHHHLYFGFDAIEIYINRCTDNSAEVLSTINDKFPHVTWHSADWIDWCPKEAKNQIQFIVYAKALAETREQGCYSHILFLDIDEFWIPQNFSTSIQAFILSLTEDGPVFFEWVNDFGNLPPFSDLPVYIEGNLSPLGKTMLPVNVDLIEFRHHLPLLKDGVLPKLVNGESFLCRNRPVQALDAGLNSLKHAFIYHRAHRSQLEYVSLLYRGRPGNEFNYKNNRTGLAKRTLQTVCIQLPHHIYSDYSFAFAKFLQTLSIKGELRKARNFVKARYSTSIENMDQDIASHYKDMMKIFCRVDVPEVVEKFRKHRERVLSSDPQNIPLMRDLARDAEKQDINEAIEILEKALKIRPKGPLIKAKLAEYYARLTPQNSPISS
jgi:hypothetical protein